MTWRNGVPLMNWCNDAVPVGMPEDISQTSVVLCVWCQGVRRGGACEEGGCEEEGMRRGRVCGGCEEGVWRRM